jgi:ABC-2 type transport system permease protein
MDSDIRKGTLSPQLLKPIHPIHHLFTRVIASKPLQVILVGPPIALAAILLGARYDLSIPTVLLALVAIVGGLLIEFFAQAIIGTSAFWITQATSLAEAWFLLRSILSGWIVPIDLFPPAITSALMWLPFRYCLSFPIEIVMGRLSIEQIGIGLVIQYAWAVGFLVLFRRMWQRGLKHYGAVGA